MPTTKTKKRPAKTGIRSTAKSSSRKTSASKTPRGKNKTSKKTARKTAVKKPRARKKPAVKKSAPKKRTTAKSSAATRKKTSKSAQSKTTAPARTASRRTASQKHKPPVKTPMPAYGGAKSYLFTSYSHKDMKTVFKVLKSLNRSRYRIWYDEGIEPGNEWPEVVGKSVIKCSQFLVFMSPSASASRNVRNEINLAFNENKDIIVVFLDETRLSEGLKLQIGSVQYINKFETTEREFYEKLKKVLKTEIRG